MFDATSDAERPDATSDTSDAGGTDDGGGPVARTGPFDPDHVYLWTSLDEHTCERGAIAALDGSEELWVGFPCGAKGHSIRANGELIYLDTTGDLGFTGSVRTFVPDAWETSMPYPAAPSFDDPVLPTEPCERVSAIEALADSAHYLYWCARCSADCGHHSGATDFEIWGWPGRRGRWLVSRPSFEAEYGVREPSGTIAPAAIRVGTIGDVVTVRARDDGFRLVTTQPGTGEILTQIDFDGTATRVGVFPAIDGAAFTYLPQTCKLDAADALYCPGPGVVLRRVIGASEPEVVLDLETDTRITDARILFTGP